jgi:hypothetical protein
MTPSALPIARKGIRSANDFTLLMSALFADVLEGTVTTDVANSMSRIGNNLLKAVEMQHKYGSANHNDTPKKQLELVDR